MADMVKVCAGLALFLGWAGFGLFRCVDAYPCTGGVVVKDYIGMPTCIRPVLKVSP